MAVLPVFEELETLRLLSGAILGNVWADPTALGVRGSNALGVPGETVYLDLGIDQQPQNVTTVDAKSTELVATTGQLGGIAADSKSSSLQVTGLLGTITHLRVTMDLTNNGASPVNVALISPVGQTVPNLPNLFQIQPGEHFVGSFDDSAQTPVTLAPRPLSPGTYLPEQFFRSPPSHIDGTSPNGTWGLVFFGDSTGLVLKSWSLTITTPDPSTTTDARGNYAFYGLAPDTYHVVTLPAAGERQTSPAGGASRTVEVIDGRTVSGVDFGVQTASYLSTTSFYLSSPATSWGQDVTLHYTLTNRGNADALAFDVGVQLSPDGVISTSDLTLKTLHFSGLAAHTSINGSVTLTLPAAPSGGFAATSDAYIGLFIDPLRRLARNVATDSANQGLGIDAAALSVAPNQAVSSGASTQQMPSIAVDPTNPNHLVVAYLDYGLVDSGYAGVGVQVSNDGGTTWTASTVPLPVGFDEGAGAPTVQFDGKGKVFVGFMAATFLGPNKPAQTDPSSPSRLYGFQSNNGIFVAASDDGGLTWGAPAAVASHTFTGAPGTAGTTGPDGTQVPFDVKPSFGVDAFPTLPNGQPNPHYGDLYAAWVRVYPAGQFPGDTESTDGSDILFAVSSDGGQTWATRTQTDPTTGATVSAIRDPLYGNADQGAPGRGFSFYPQVSVGPDGDLYVSAYVGGSFVVFYSSDNGNTFRTPDYDNQLGIPFPNQVLPAGTSAADNFRTLPVRSIVADPSHPGRVYAVEATSVSNVNLGTMVDTGDVIFAVSNDYGQTWDQQFQVGTHTTNLASLPPGQNDTFLSVLNDDNHGRFVGYDTLSQLNSEVLAGQALPAISVDASGHLTVIWYDTRRDPLGVGTDVFGTVSSNGGKTFSPNFRITDTTFNPNDGAFTSATGATTYYFGDKIGVVASNGVAYAVWTDTRHGGQQVFLQKYSLAHPQQAPLDRFYPNDAPERATMLGPLTSRTVLPLLRTGPGDDNWYNLQGGDDGTLDVVAMVDQGDASLLNLELTDDAGNVLPATIRPILNASGAIVGIHLVYPSVTGVTYLVHVSGSGAIGYSLALTDLTAELGSVVQGRLSSVMAPGSTYAYRLEAGVSGTLELTLTPGPDAVSQMVLLAVNEANGNVQSLLGQSDGSGAGVPQTFRVPVSRGQVVVLLVMGTDETSEGSFTLEYTNLDQYKSPGVTGVFLPTAGTPASVAVGSLSGSGVPSILVSSTDTSDTIQVLSGNADGTFQAAHQYGIGPGLSGFLTAGYRQLVLAELNGDGTADVVVPNFRAGDVSVLLGNGDGTFQPQRTFDAVVSPESLVTADFDGDGQVDLAVLENFPQLGGFSMLAILIGRGDGTFKPAVNYTTPFADGAGPMVVADLTGTGNKDILIFSKNSPFAQVFLDNGDGTFRDGGTFSTGENVYAAEAVDLPGIGLSIITTGTTSGNVYIVPGNGDGIVQLALSVHGAPAGAVGHQCRRLRPDGRRFPEHGAGEFAGFGHGHGERAAGHLRHRAVARWRGIGPGPVPARGVRRRGLLQRLRHRGSGGEPDHGREDHGVQRPGRDEPRGHR
ncbi:MAG: FG-GAP-like repeat-containing protein [Isosphaeraceae bacterium]